MLKNKQLFLSEQVSAKMATDLPIYRYHQKRLILPMPIVSIHLYFRYIINK